MFCRTVEAHSFVAAARSMDVVPSVLSKAVRGLEEDLGFTLFNRSTRKLSLTPEGTAYYERCRQLILDLDEAESFAREGVSKPTGILRVGMHPVCRFPLMDQIGQFLEAHPSLRLETVLTNSPAALLADGLDVIIRIGALEDSGLVARQIGAADFLVCASPGYLQIHGEPLHPNDLANHRAVIYGRGDEEPNTKWRFDRLKESLLIAVPVRLLSRDGIGLMDAVASGAGVARPYRLAARRFLEQGRVRALLGDWSCDPHPIFAVHPQSRVVPAKVVEFVQFAKTALSG
jgi:LysR family transcriptional regulator for bpeEF and oprC